MTRRSAGGARFWLWLPLRTESRMVRPWLTRPAAISLRPSAPFSTLTLAPASPLAASLTISGSWSISIRSSATRSYEDAASAWIFIRFASAVASTRIRSASASARFTVSPPHLRTKHFLLRLGVGQRTALGALGLRPLHLGRVLGPHHRGLPGVLGLVPLGRL